MPHRYRYKLDGDALLTAALGSLEPPPRISVKNIQRFLEPLSAVPKLLFLDHQWYMSPAFQTLSHHLRSQAVFAYVYNAKSTPYLRNLGVVVEREALPVVLAVAPRSDRTEPLAITAIPPEDLEDYGALKNHLTSFVKKHPGAALPSPYHGYTELLRAAYNGIMEGNNSPYPRTLTVYDMEEQLFSSSQSLWVIKFCHVWCKCCCHLFRCRTDSLLSLPTALLCVPWPNVSPAMTAGPCNDIQLPWNQLAFFVENLCNASQPLAWCGPEAPLLMHTATVEGDTDFQIFQSFGVQTYPLIMLVHAHPVYPGQPTKWPKSWHRNPSGVTSIRVNSEGEVSGEGSAEMEEAYITPTALRQAHQRGLLVDDVEEAASLSFTRYAPLSSEHGIVNDEWITVVSAYEGVPATHKQLISWFGSAVEPILEEAVGPSRTKEFLQAVETATLTKKPTKRRSKRKK